MGEGKMGGDGYFYLLLSLSKSLELIVRDTDWALRNVNFIFLTGNFAVTSHKSLLTVVTHFS